MTALDSISIIIPALDEADRIGDTLRFLNKVVGSREVEVIVVDGHPEKTTIRAIPKGPVRGIWGPKGRGAQLHTGALASSGAILLFLHADTRLLPGALTRVREVLCDPEIAGGAFALGIDAPGAAYRIIEKGANFRCRLTKIPYGDQAVFLRRNVYFAVGGFRPIPLMEDVDLMQRLKRGGHRIRLIRQPVRTSARRWQKEGAVRCTLRNYALILLYLLGVCPRRLAAFYR